MAEPVKKSSATLRKEKGIAQSQEIARQKAASALSLEEAQGAAVGAHQTGTIAGSKGIREQAAAGLAGALGAAPQTGLGAKAAAGAQAGKQAGMGVATFEASQADKLGSMKEQQAQKLGDARTAAAEAELAATTFEEEAKPEFSQEARNAKMTELDAGINAILKDEKYQGFWDDDEDAAAMAIEQLIKSETDPFIIERYRGIADKVRSKEIDIGSSWGSSNTQI